MDVEIVRSDNAAVFGDSDIANIVVAGGHLVVSELLSGDFRNAATSALLVVPFRFIIVVIICTSVKCDFPLVYCIYHSTAVG